MLQKSLKNLMVKSGATQGRLWGKIRGTVKDYYIAEGSLELGEAAEGEGGEGVDPGEPRGQGVNKNVYWVTNTVHGEWTLLPDLKP